MEPGQSFTAFITKFETLLAAAGSIFWTDEIKTNYLRLRISNRIRFAAVLNERQMLTYFGMVNTYKRIAQALEAIDINTKLNKKGTHPQ